MKEHIWIKQIPNQDLSVYQFGYEDCESGHSFGPASRDHYLLHFIKSGKGEFFIDNKHYSLIEKTGFLISPGKISSYKADISEPWRYFWIGFGGINAEYYLKQAGVTADNPIFSFNKTAPFLKIFNELKNLDRASISDRLKMTGCMFNLLAEMVKNISAKQISAKTFYNSKEEYVKNALLFITQNYSEKITVDEIAKFIGLNRSYFAIIFKEITGMSPVYFIINYRIDAAKKLLSDITMSIGDVSRSVGYDDPLAFSKQFKKTVGISPTEYRRQNVQ